jgi:uncharacterized protein YbaP (TraB family)
MRVLRHCAVALAVLLGAGPAAAQSFAGDPEAVIAEELVIRARVPGPVWWKVSDADSTVWILGAPAALSKSAAWNTQPLALRLQGARVVRTPVTGRISTLAAVSFMLRNSGAFRSETPLEEMLSPDMRARFVAARETLGKPASRYARWKPGMAALLLTSDFYEGVDIDSDEPLETIRRVARRARAPVEKGDTYDMRPLLREFASLDEAAQVACLDDAVRLVEAGRGAVIAASEGWAAGDLPRALSAERGFERCFAAMPTAVAATRRALGDTTTMVTDALATPGVTVIVAGLRGLVAREGVVARLRARGIEVQTPDA